LAEWPDIEKLYLRALRRRSSIGPDRRANATSVAPDSETTLGSSMFGARPPNALNWSGFRNMTKQPEQA
jgi:hypothetical protein